MINDIPAGELEDGVKRDWIVAHDGSRGPMGFECLQCSGFEAVNTPINIKRYLEKAKDFRLRHMHDKIVWCKTEEQ